jgi:hypothetical protein
MSAGARIKLAVGTRVLLTVRWLLLRTRPKTWARLAKLVRPLVRRPPARAALDEVIDILAGGEPGPSLVRAMLQGSTREELEDLAWGALIFDPEWSP